MERWSATVKTLSILTVCLLAACQTVAEEDALPRNILVIENGMVFDGTGSPGKIADVVVEDGKITYAGQRDGHGGINPAARIDATGLIVAPGFIDPHTHADSDLKSDDPKRRANLAFAFQGVTTVMTGNDGHGTSNVAEISDKMRQSGIGTNVAHMAGFGYMRKTAIGNANRAPTDAELEAMKTMMEGAMCQGAFGLSAGLYYTPQNFADTDEVAALTEVAARHGGYYDTHMRDESTYNIGVTGALREALEIGTRSGARVHISHIKALGPAVWGHSEKMIALVEQARTSGQQVTADQYPWAASGTRISNALVPRWALEGGLPAMRERLNNGDTLARIKTGMAENLKRRGGAEKLLVTGKLGDAKAEIGKTLADLAAQQSLPAVDTAIEILKLGDARVASFNMSSDDIMAFAKQPWVVTGSDGSTGHPRKYASFPKAYRDFVVDQKIMDISAFIRRSSGQTADIIGLTNRGYLKKGLAADIVIFDPKTFAPRATYEQPEQFSDGVKFLFVNGTPLIFDGKYQDSLPGEFLLKETSC